MHIVVTGANGQVGRELLRATWPAGTTVTGLTSAELDITDEAAVSAGLGDLAPDVVVNAAAFTAVDTAEDEEERATEVNATAVGNLATWINAAGALLVHYSTDYVFDGSNPDWYDEDDSPAPIGAYGRSKLAGEQAAATADRHMILRTAWVYGALGSNFVTTMLRLAATRDELGVVDDQVGCPTAAIDIAAATVDLISTTPEPHGIINVASPDQATWHEVAMATFEASKAGFDGTCKKLRTAEYPTKAVRPPNSRLSTDRLESLIGRRLPSWKESLPRVVAELESADEGSSS